MVEPTVYTISLIIIQPKEKSKYIIILKKSKEKKIINKI